MAMMLMMVGSSVFKWLYKEIITSITDRDDEDNQELIANM